MATVAPPPPKRQRREETDRAKVQQDVTQLKIEGSFRTFFEVDGKRVTDGVELPLDDLTPRNLNLLLNTLLGRGREDSLLYRFGIPIPGTDTLDPLPSREADIREFIRKHGLDRNNELECPLRGTVQSVFKVQPPRRLAHRIPGHGEAVLCATFSPATSSLFATGSGDKTARIWDTQTGTPKHTLKGHAGWIFDVSWSPDGEKLATCSKDKTIRIWDPKTGKQIGSAFLGHTLPVLSLAWEPYHLWTDDTARLASASKDHSVRIWVVNTGRTEHVLGGHKDSVTCVKWGGTSLIYTASYDRTIIVWDARAGTLVHHLKSHTARVNQLALSTDFVLRTGFFGHTKNVPDDKADRRAAARDRYEQCLRREAGTVSERLVSASDDNTMFLWDPTNNGNKPVVRLLGHQNVVNHICFSPDVSLIASASFDNQVKIWSAKDGKWLRTLRGHVGRVYRCSFSADSRLLVSGSKDTTVKVWDVETGKLVSDLPGHEDEVFAVDWSPDGQLVGSGGNDKAVRLWRS